MYLTVGVSPTSALLSTNLPSVLTAAPVNIILPIPRTLDEYTPHKNWSAILYYYYYHIMIRL